MSEQQDYIDRDRGTRAQALLDDPLLTEAFANIEDAYVQEWKENKRNLGPEGREMLWQAVQVIGKVRNHLEQAVSDGKLAAASIDQLHPSHRLTT